MLFFPALLGIANIFDDYVSDLFQTVFLVHEIGSERGSGDFWQMFVFLRSPTLPLRSGHRRLHNPQG
jgi:hypothetical protein